MRERYTSPNSARGMAILKQINGSAGTEHVSIDTYIEMLKAKQKEKKAKNAIGTQQRSITPV